MPKCNKVLNVINSKVANYSNYSNKRRIWGGGVTSAAALIRIKTVLRSITMVLSAAVLEKKN